MAITNFYGTAIPLTPAARVAVGDTSVQNGVATINSLNSVVDVHGVDTIIGGSGSNTYYVGATTTLVQGATTGIDTVVASVDYVLPATITNLTMNWSFAGFGNSGANYILGTAGGNLIDGGGGDDVLTGGSGTTYEFDGGQSGHTLITDFVAGTNTDGGKTDEVRLDGYSQFTTFAQVQAAMAQVGSDVVLTLNSTTAIKFADTQISQFTAANFELALSPSSYGAASFADNFSSLSLWNGSTGVWATNYGWSGNPDSAAARNLPGTGEKEVYVDAALTGTGKTALGLNPYSVSGGVLTIHAAPTPAADVSSLWGFNYTSGMISTRYTFTQTYGYFDAEMKLPSGQGNWPAFWLYAVNGNSELDVMEEHDGSDQFTGTAHNNGSGGAATGVSDYIPNLTDGFHNFGVLWTPQTITWYVDGVDIGSVATPSNMNGPMYMIANLAVDSSVPSNYAGGDLEIQYIHAYTLANSPVPAPTTTASTTTASTTTASTTAASTTSASTTSASTTAASTTAASTTAASTTSASTTSASTTSAPAAHAAPSLTSLSAALPSGATTLKAGATAQISLTFNENLTVTGAPTLKLSDGETATFVKGSGTNVLTFAYTASAGDSSSDLQVSSVNLPSGSKIVDGSGISVGALSGDLKISVDAVTTTVTPTTVTPTPVTSTTVTPTAPVTNVTSSTLAPTSVTTPTPQVVHGTGSHDVFLAQSSSDVFIEPAVNDGTAQVLSSYSFVMPANVTVLHLIGSGNITGTANNMNGVYIYGNAGNDTLVAGTGADTLVAGSGGGTLTSGAGNDTMVGGAGADTFLFNKTAGTQDFVFSFGAKDVINISAYLSAGLTPHLSDTLAGEVISFTNGASIELLGVHSSQLVSTSVGFVHA